MTGALSSPWFYRVAFSSVTLIHLIGMFNEILGIDANLYATISQQILHTGEWLQIKSGPLDYLDKPPLHFWLSALSFKVFGVSEFAYRLPSFLALLLGVYSTYKLGQLLYNETVGKLSALVLYTAQAAFLMTQDVRTDTMLVGFLVFAVWQLIAFSRTNHWKHLILGSLGIGLAMLTKGPIGLMLPAFALGMEFALKRQWQQFWNWKWLLGLLTAGVLLIPMVWGLYQQWDLHPEKTLYGQDDISGVKFYFWDQSFGRLTGDNPFINYLEPNQTYDPTYFIHTSLWAFMPWIFLALFALGIKLKLLYKARFKLTDSDEGATLGAILLPFLALSLSSYVLPHYIYITYPFLAILTAWYIRERLSSRLQALQTWVITHSILAGVLVLLSIIILVIVFPAGSSLGWLALVIGIAALTMGWLYFRDQLSRLVVVSVASICTINLVMNLIYYPSLGQYQPGDSIHQTLTRLKVQNADVVLYRTVNDALDFHRGEKLRFTGSVAQVIPEDRDDIWVYTTADQVKTIQAYFHVIEHHPFDAFQVMAVNAKFLNHETRDESLHQVHVFHIKRKANDPTRPN